MSQVAAPPPLQIEGPYGMSLLLRGSLRAMLRNPGALVTAGALPFALLMLAHVAFTSGQQEQVEVQSGEGALSLRIIDSGGGGLLELLVNLAAASLFAVSWHRFLLGYGAPRLLPPLGQHHLRYFGFSALVLLLPILPLLVAGLISGPAPTDAAVAPGVALVLGFLWLVPAIWITLRWSLTLPASAVEVPLGLRESWRATRGKVLPMFLATLVGGLLLFFASAVFFLLLAAIVGESDAAARSVAGGDRLLVLLFHAAGELVFLLELALGAGILSLAVTRLIPDP